MFRRRGYLSKWKPKHAPSEFERRYARKELVANTPPRQKNEIAVATSCSQRKVTAVLGARGKASIPSLTPDLLSRGCTAIMPGSNIVPVRRGSIYSMNPNSGSTRDSDTINLESSSSTSRPNDASTLKSNSLSIRANDGAKLRASTYTTRVNDTAGLVDISSIRVGTSLANTRINETTYVGSGFYNARRNEPTSVATTSPDSRYENAGPLKKRETETTISESTADAKVHSGWEKGLSRSSDTQAPSSSGDHLRYTAAPPILSSLKTLGTHVHRRNPAFQKPVTPLRLPSSNMSRQRTKTAGIRSTKLKFQHSKPCEGVWESDSSETDSTSSDYDSSEESDVAFQRQRNGTFSIGRPLTPMPQGRNAHRNSMSRLNMRKKSCKASKNKGRAENDMGSFPKLRNLARLGDISEDSDGDESIDPPFEAGRLSIKEKLETCLALNIPFLPHQVLDAQELELFLRFENIHSRRSGEEVEVVDTNFGGNEIYSDDELDILYDDLQLSARQSMKPSSRQTPVPVVDAGVYRNVRARRCLESLHKVQLRAGLNRLPSSEILDVLNMRRKIEKSHDQEVLRGGGRTYSKKGLVHFVEWMRFKEKEVAIGIADQNQKLYNRLKKVKSVYSRAKQLEDFKKHEAFVMTHRPIANLANLRRMAYTSKIGLFPTISRRPAFKLPELLKPFQTHFAKTEPPVKKSVIPLKPRLDIMKETYRSPLLPPIGCNTRISMTQAGRRH